LPDVDVVEGKADWITWGEEMDETFGFSLGYDFRGYGQSWGRRLASAVKGIFNHMFSMTGGIMFTSRYGGRLGGSGRDATHPDSKPVNVDAILSMTGRMRNTAFGMLGLHFVSVAENTVNAGESFRDAYWFARDLKDPNTPISEKVNPEVEDHGSFRSWEGGDST